MSSFALGSIAVLAVLGPAADSEAPLTIELLVLDIEGVGLEEVERALEVRLPDRARIRVGDARARARDALWGYVQVRPVDGGWALALILADQRGYYREIEGGDGGDDARRVASTITNLIASVEEDAVPADEENVALPEFGPEEPEPTPEEPEPTPEEPEPPAELPPVPPYDIGAYLGASAVLSVGPPDPTGLAAAAGTAGLDVRLLRGLLLGAAYRGATRAEDPYRVTRHRVQLHVGYALRRGAFEALLAAGAFVEPWRIRSQGTRAPLQDDDGTARDGATLLGGLLRLAPGARFPLGERWAMRIAPVLEATGSSIVGPNSGVARVRDLRADPPTDLFRLGGLELSAGLELGFWWSASPTRRP